jgi:hypothetical protein
LYLLIHSIHKKKQKSNSMKRITRFPLLAIAGATAIMAFGMSACSKKSSGGGGGTPPPTPLGGYVSSDSVAPSNLVGYWPFDADGNDHKGGLTATTTGSASYSTAGVRGKCYTGGDSVFLTFTLPSGGGSYSSLGSYSESFWFKVSAQDTVTQGVFFMEGANTQDELVTEIEPFKAGVSGSDDSVNVHTGFNDLNGPAYQLFVPETFDTNAVGKWVHEVITYNGGTSVYTVYQDAIPMGTKTAFSNGGYITPNPMWTDGNATTPLGMIGFTSDPPKTLLIGTWPDQLFGQSQAHNTFRGNLDEFRIYNKALSQQEVSGLFLNGQAGR